MNRKIAKFELVSKPIVQSSDLLIKLPPEEKFEEFYSSLKLPKRATALSAGYDFYSTCDITLEPSDYFVFPTFVRCKMEKGWMLSIFPRSGLGFKNHVVLANTVGIIDADYYNSSNEGHIMIKLINNHPKFDLNIKFGDAIAQGVFIPHGITIDDDAKGKRNGGFGSTDKK